MYNMSELISDTPLKCPLNTNTTDIERREAHKNFLMSFKRQSYLPVELKLGTATATVELLIANRTSWHKSCPLKFTTSKLEKAKELQSGKEKTATRRNSKRRQASRNNEVCIFCNSTT